MENQNATTNPGTIVRRYLAEGTWLAESAIHPGGGEDSDSGADQSIYRAADGSAVIPGTTIAGCSRSLAARLTSPSLQQYRSGQDHESSVIGELFGGHYASLLHFFDGRAVLPKAAPTVQVRDGVRIEMGTGIAADDARYNYEALPAGTLIPVRILLEIPHKFANGGESRLTGAWALLLSEIEKGGLQLGAKTRKGLGRGRVHNWTIRRFDMSQPVHAAAWIARTANGGDALPLADLLPYAPARLDHWFEIEAQLRLKTSVLLRSAGRDPSLPDFVQLTEAGVPLIAGTSWAGVIRSRVETIVNTRTKTKGANSDGRKWSERIFGPLKTNRGRTTRPLHAGRVWVDEMPLTAVKLEAQSRVAIDRFTGGSLETALFDEAPAWPQNTKSHHGILRVRYQIEGDQYDSTCQALLLQAVKDVWLGDLAVGGESGVGRGVWQGVSLTLRHPGCEHPLTMTLADAKTPEAVRLSGWNDAWRKLTEVAI